MRRILAHLVFSLFLATLGQGTAQVSVAEVESLIENGSYAIVAQVSGPSLIRDFPNDPEAHYLYAEALYLTGDTISARTQLDQALALAGSEPPADFEVLNALLRATEGDTEGAKRLLRNTFIRTRDYEVALAWGRVAWQSSDYETALEAFTAAAQTEQGSREVWAQLNRGRMLTVLGRTDEAIAAFQAAIDIFRAHDPGDAGPPNPGYVEAFFRLGEIYEDLGDTREAESYYTAARGLDPNYAPAISALDRLKRSSP